MVTELLLQEIKAKLKDITIITKTDLLNLLNKPKPFDAQVMDIIQQHFGKTPKIKVKNNNDAKFLQKLQNEGK